MDRAEPAAPVTRLGLMPKAPRHRAGERDLPDPIPPGPVVTDRNVGFVVGLRRTAVGTLGTRAAQMGRLLPEHLRVVPDGARRTVPVGATPFRAIVPDKTVGVVLDLGIPGIRHVHAWGKSAWNAAFLVSGRLVKSPSAGCCSNG